MSGLVKADVLGEEPDSGTDAAGRSTQLPEDSWDYDKTGAKEPPYNLDALAYFLEISTWHLRCCTTLPKPEVLRHRKIMH